MDSVIWRSPVNDQPPSTIPTPTILHRRLPLRFAMECQAKRVVSQESVSKESWGGCIQCERDEIAKSVDFLVRELRSLGPIDFVRFESATTVERRLHARTVRHTQCIHSLPEELNILKLTNLQSRVPVELSVSVSIETHPKYDRGMRALPHRLSTLSNLTSTDDCDEGTWIGQQLRKITEGCKVWVARQGPDRDKSQRAMKRLFSSHRPRRKAMHFSMDCER